MLIFLTGPRGAGKSTFGKFYAAYLQCLHLDTDAEAARLAGQSIAALVDAQGWEAFRRLESSILNDIVNKQAGKKAVISTGGGIILAKENRSLMREHGLVVYLQTTPVLLAQRLAANPDLERRPPLPGTPGSILSLEQEMVETLAKREGLYLECAHYILDAALPPPLLAEQLDKLITRAV